MNLIKLSPSNKGYKMIDKFVVVVISTTISILIASALICGLVYSILYYTGYVWLGFLVMMILTVVVALVMVNFIWSWVNKNL